MATNTYVALDKKTVTSAVGSIDFTSIPSTYTDLILVVDATVPTSENNLDIRFNNDTANNYSYTQFAGSGTSVFSSYSASQPSGRVDYYGYVTPNRYLNIIQIMNYASTNMYKSILSRSGNSANGTSTVVNLWRKTPEAIHTITLFVPGNTFSTGSTFSLYGVQKGTAVATSAKATGGTITYASDGYTYHTFTSSGTFTPSANITCDYLVVAGGGGGSRINAGGGAGGLRSTVDMTGGGGTLETALALTSGTGYTVTVGAGGAGGTATGGSNGSNSVFGSITSIGGGGGGPYVGTGGGNSTGFSGGSGGGAGFNESNANNLGGTATSSQGFAGGATTLLYTSGGGGGAGGPGAAGITYAPAGAGGIGARIPTFAAATGTGVSNYYAGGGGAGDEDFATRSGIGGLGGGGNGADRTGGSTRLAGSTGTTNTGSGGGGGENGGTNGYAGGSGIVIIRYAN